MTLCHIISYIFLLLYCCMKDNRPFWITVSWLVDHMITSFSFQSKPLIPLQTEFDQTQEKRFLTCYMFPQHSLSEIEAGKLWLLFFQSIHVVLSIKVFELLWVLANVLHIHFVIVSVLPRSLLRWNWSCSLFISYHC